MKHYRILSATNEDTLAEYIETAINDGWELAGPMAIGPVNTPAGGQFYQPIIKVKRDYSGKSINPGPKS